MADYYKILGIGSNASSEEIRRAYRYKAKKLHPDVNKSADAKILFQQINEAFHTLINADKRRRYDLRLKYDSLQYRKYGRNYQHRHDDTSQPYSYYSYYTKNKPYSYEEKILKRRFRFFSDTFFFIIMLIIGMAALVFGINDLFFTKWEGIGNMTGILFGLSFCVVLIYGWYLRSKTDKKDINSGFFN